MVADWMFPAVQYVLGVLGGVAAALLGMVLLELRKPDALRSFRKLPDEARSDFHRLTVAAGVMFGSFALYAVGGYYGRDAYLIAGRLAEIVFFGVAITVFARWWRRFG